MFARGVIVLIAGLVATAIQGVLLHLSVPPYALPQLTVLLVVFLAFNEVSVFGSCLAFALGLLLDFSSAILIGPWAGAMVAAYGFLAALSQRLFIESALVAVVTSFVAVLVVNMVYMALAYEYRPIAWEYIVQAFGEAMVTALISPLVLGFLTRRFRRRASSSYPRSTVGSVA